MTAELPASLGAGFAVAATELGMASAARLYVEEIAAALGAPGVEAARDALGREFSVFDAYASSWLARGALPRLDVDSVLPHLEGARRLLVVGAEADALDALVPRLPSMPVGLVVGGGGLEPDAPRFAANYGERVEVVPLSAWTRWAGARSALLTFVYGADGHVAFVAPAYLRLAGPDVRSAFRALLGWNLLGAPPRLHPRYLAETSLEELPLLVGEAAP